MNSTEIKQLSLAYNELFKNTKQFNEFKESLANSLESDVFDNEKIEKVSTEYKKRLEALAQFERELDKFEQFMSPNVFKNLKDALGNEMTVLGRIVADSAGFLDTNDSMFLDSLEHSLEEEINVSELFAKETTDFATDLGFNLLMHAMDEKISLQDLQLMSIAFESDSDLHERIIHVIGVVEKRQEELARLKDEETATLTDENTASVEIGEEEVTVENNEETTLASVEQVQEPRKLTLEEKIAKINYQQGMNLNEAVQEITLESKLESIAQEIAQLQEKEKLTVKDKFRLRQLMEQQLAFETYGKNLSKQNVSLAEKRRNRRLSSNEEKYDEKLGMFVEAQDRTQAYSSTVMRFLSSRYENKLDNQLQSLREKQGLLTAKQKASAVARFDKQSKKLMRKAKRKGTIDQLRAYKESLVQEIQNLGQDISRFISTKEEDVEVLTEAVIVMPDNIVSLDERRRELSRGSMAA